MTHLQWVLVMLCFIGAGGALLVALVNWVNEACDG